MAALTKMGNRYTDLSFIRENSFNNKEFIVEMMTLFLSTTPQMLEDMQRYTGAGEWQKLGDVTHKLKAQVQTFGMNEAADIIGRVELNAKAGEHLEDIHPMVTRIYDMCRAAMAELDADLNDLQRG